MTEFSTLKARYMSDPASRGSMSTGPRPPAIVTGTKLEPLINGSVYYADFKTELAALDPSKNAFCYMHGWCLGEHFSLDSIRGRDHLTEVLKRRSRDGVDIRAVGFVAAPEIMNDTRVHAMNERLFRARQRQIPTFEVVDTSMRFLADLRTEPTLADKAVCNILNHPAGSSHLKMAIIGDDTKMIAYSGGIDFENTRHSITWEDIQLKMTGPGALEIYKYFKDIWEEIRGRTVVSIRSPYNPLSGAAKITIDSHTAAMPVCSNRTAIAISPIPNTHVQSARTIPQFNFTFGMSSFVPTNDPIAFARNGDFGIKSLWRKGISGAQNFIYVEDQAFWGTEQSDWINAQIKQNSSLRVILLIGVWDPTEPDSPINASLLARTINNHLLSGLSAAQKARICFARRDRVTIHAKSTICDDHWAAIGSANYMRRSLYTDMENYNGFMDEDGVLVHDYRESLWNMHFGFDEPNLNDAIQRWFDLPTTRATALPTGLWRDPLPLTAGTPLTDEEEQQVDVILENDSRENWGANIASMVFEQAGGLEGISS